MCRIIKIALLAFLLACCSTCAFALPSDSDQPVYLAADSITYNYKTGFTVYQGHVTVDQGTTHLTGDKVVTQDNAQHKIDQATAYGNVPLAHYWTIPKPGQQQVDAYAKIIIFYPIDSRVILKQNVTVTQGKNEFHGQLAQYSKKDQTIIVPPTLHSRAVVVYDPSSNKTPEASKQG